MDRLVVRKPRQWEALFSPVRLEIVEALELFGRSSIAEIAAELERTPHSLYHHVRRLVDVGLIEEVGSRRSGAREEALYDVCGRPVIVETDWSKPAQRRLRVQAVRSLLRQAERDYESSAEGAASDEELAPHVRRYSVRLRERSVRKIEKHLDAIVDVFLNERVRAAEGTAGARWVSWVNLLALREARAPRDTP